jgi:hypothetical protein
MSKDKKVTKAVAENYDDAQAKIVSTREELTVVKDEKKAYMKENELKAGEDYSADAKHGKKIQKWDKLIEEKKALIEELKTFAKENKPKKEKVARETSYTYPPGENGEPMTAAEKKKFRAKSRAEKKKAAKAEAEGTEPKEKNEKKGKKAEETTEEAPAEKTKKKKAKETAEAGSDD